MATVTTTGRAPDYLRLDPFQKVLKINWALAKILVVEILHPSTPGVRSDNGSSFSTEFPLGDLGYMIPSPGVDDFDNPLALYAGDGTHVGLSTSPINKEMLKHLYAWVQPVPIARQAYSYFGSPYGATWTTISFFNLSKIAKLLKPEDGRLGFDITTHLYIASEFVNDALDTIPWKIRFSTYKNRLNFPLRGPAQNTAGAPGLAAWGTSSGDYWNDISAVAEHVKVAESNNSRGEISNDHIIHVSVNLTTLEIQTSVTAVSH